MNDSRIEFFGPFELNFFNSALLIVSSQKVWIVKFDFWTSVKYSLFDQTGIFYYKLLDNIKSLPIEKIKNKFDYLEIHHNEILSIEVLASSFGKNKIVIETSNQKYKLFIQERHLTEFYRTEIMNKIKSKKYVFQ